MFVCLIDYFDLFEALFDCWIVALLGREAKVVCLFEGFVVCLRVLFVGRFCLFV